MAEVAKTNVHAIPIKQLGKILTKYPDVVNAKFDKALDVFGKHFINVLVKERMTGKKGVQPPGGGLQRRSGDLARKWDMIVKRKSPTNAQLSVYSPVKYAAIHEFGGTIRPKRSKYLTIPLEPTLTAAGVLRAPARDWPDTFFYKSKKGNLFIARMRGDEIENLFLLKTEVYIPPRLGARDLLKREGKTLKDLMGKAVAAALRQIFKQK